MASSRPTPAAIREALYPIEDPELGLSILELGLIYDVEVSDAGDVVVTMTLTSLACPVGPLLEAMVFNAAQQVSGVADVKVNLVFSPPWDPRIMASDDVKLTLGIW